MNWILDEVKESIQDKIRICEGFMELCESQMRLLKDILQEIEEITQEKDKILDEQIRDFELAEEDLREKRENAKYGI